MAEEIRNASLGSTVFAQATLASQVENEVGHFADRVQSIIHLGKFPFGDPVIIHTRNKPKRMVERTRRHRLKSRVCLRQIGFVCSPNDMIFTELFVFWARIQAVFMLALWQHLFTRKNKRLSKIPEG